MLRRYLLLISSLLVLPGLGCAKRSYAEASAPSMDYDGGAAMAGSAAPSEPAPAPERAYNFDEANLESAKKSMDSEDVSPTSVQAAPSGGAPRPSGGVKPTIGSDKPLSPETTPTKDEPSEEDKKKQFARQIIYTAELQLSVYKLDESMQRAEELTLASGGYVQNMSQGYYVLRIPAPALRGIMDELARAAGEPRRHAPRRAAPRFIHQVTRLLRVCMIVAPCPAPTIGVREACSGPCQAWVKPTRPLRAWRR